MITIETTYLGGLRTASTHVKSQETLFTDAPVDNQGKGETFSPTDLMTTALGGCMLTIMGIKARDMEIDIEGTRMNLTKVMGVNPRRVEKIIVDVQLNASFDDKTKQILEGAALNCPVAKSLSADLIQEVTFNYPS